jgi:predicted AAA+ superfamily ATPase
MREYLTYGSYPEVVKSKGWIKQEYLYNIVRTSIEEDIIAYFSLREREQLWQLARHLSAAIGELINISELGNYATVSRYLSILHHSYIIELIPNKLIINLQNS